MMIEFPLTKANRIRLAQAYRAVQRVDLSIECAIEGQMGRAFVDQAEVPTVFKIQVGPFFYLAGDAAGAGGAALLQEMAPYSLFMPSAPGWLEAAQAMYTDRLVGFERCSFSSAGLNPEHLTQLFAGSPLRDRVMPIDRALAEKLYGADHFIDLSDYDSAEDFVQRGLGFCVAEGEQVLGAAFASLVCSTGIEVSIYVEEGFRRQGMAAALAARLLLACLEQNLDAHWDAANPESCALAEKLGYQPAGSYWAYFLKR